MACIIQGASHNLLVGTTTAIVLGPNAPFHILPPPTITNIFISSDPRSLGCLGTAPVARMLEWPFFNARDAGSVTRSN